MTELRKTAKNIMTKNPITFTPTMSVKEAAKILAEKDIGGAPVLDSNGRLVGIVTESDLIVQDVRLRFPTYIELLDGYLYLPGSLEHFEEEFKKAIGAEVADVMTMEVITVGEGTSIEDIATLMVEKDIGRVPVMSGDRVVGIVTKGDIVRAISRG